MIDIGDGRLPARFWAKVEVSANGCWLWSGQRDRDDYGTLKWQGKQRRAHRVSYEALVEPIGDGLQTDHLCRIRRCVNPAHLEPVTPRENTMRGDSFAGINYRKNECAAGHPLEGDNLAVRPTGWRGCRECDRLRMRAVRGTADREHQRPKSMLTIDGIAKPRAVWAKEAGLLLTTIQCRLARGETGQMLLRPARVYGRRTGALRRAGLLGWTVTEAGHEALRDRAPGGG